MTKGKLKSKEVLAGSSQVAFPRKALEEAICLVDAIRLNCMIQRAREDKAWRNGSNSDLEESCDREGNYSAFMAIALVDSSEDLNALMEELGEHIEMESMGVGGESGDEGEECVYEGTKGL
ncbi:hypothetical protein SO802_022625 [Lithocarpus litseifolius]|uniref:Uncharacterized protein n=1 Tax=Lithocarpus litseifolius TaxID=425828 RepID=A0AAW2C4A8_9ROSI